MDNIKQNFLGCPLREVKWTVLDQPGRTLGQRPRALWGVRLFWLLLVGAMMYCLGSITLLGMTLWVFWLSTKDWRTSLRFGLGIGAILVVASGLQSLLGGTLAALSSPITVGIVILLGALGLVGAAFNGGRQGTSTSKGGTKP